MRFKLWKRVADAAKNFVRSPLPTLTVWLGDALSWAGLALYGKGLEWRIKRQADPRATFWAVVDVVLIVVAVTLIAWGL